VQPADRSLPDMTPGSKESRSEPVFKITNLKHPPGVYGVHFLASRLKELWKRVEVGFQRDSKEKSTIFRVVGTVYLNCFPPEDPPEGHSGQLAYNFVIYTVKTALTLISASIHRSKSDR
jgi:hypothetical protein